MAIRLQTKEVNKTTYNPRKYGTLLRAFLPGVIDSDAEYIRTEKVFNDLFKENRSPEEDRLFNLLANLLEDYEKRTLPPLEKSSSVETLKFLMEENKLKQKDLVGVFSSQGIVSEVLNEKREISKKHAKLLADRFSVSVELFI